MYNPETVAIIIKETATRKNITVKQMLIDLNLGKNYMGHMSNGKMPVSDNLAKIADYLDCSVDYLLGRENNSYENTDEDLGITLYKQLDFEDKAEIRGEMKHMLKADKYSNTEIKLIADSDINAPAVKKKRPPRISD